MAECGFAVSAEEIAAVLSTLDDLGVLDEADGVICAIDSPDDIHLIVNEACFVLGVPFVAGGLSYSTLSYWSVDPGRTPCRLCLERHHDDEARTLPPILRQAPLIEPRRVNRGTGPIVQLISGLMSMEVMRYLTRTDPPVAAATYLVIELADQMETIRMPWRRHPDAVTRREIFWAWIFLCLYAPGVLVTTGYFVIFALPAVTKIIATSLRAVFSGGVLSAAGAIAFLLAVASTGYVLWGLARTLARICRQLISGSSPRRRCAPRRTGRGRPGGRGGSRRTA